LIRLTRIIIYFIDQFLFKQIPSTPFNTNDIIIPAITIYVPGVFGYPKTELVNLPYWNSLRYSGFYSTLITPNISPINNFTDRACELFFSINGETIKYLRKKDNLNAIIEIELSKDEKENYTFVELPYRKNDILVKDFLKKDKINFVAHSNGGFTIIRMFDLLDKGYFDTKDKCYSKDWQNHIGKIVFISCGLYGQFGNYTNFFKISKLIDIVKVIIYYIGNCFLLLLQLLVPYKIRKRLYDPYLDIYLLNKLSALNPFFIYNISQIKEIGTKFPIPKTRVIELLKKSNANIYNFITSLSENVYGIELLKPFGNPIIKSLSVPFSLSTKTKQIHDGIVPVESMLGCIGIKEQKNNLLLEIINDQDVIKELNLKQFGYLIDHLSVIGAPDNIETDKIIWAQIIDIINT
jgi:hypothetical protein